MDMLDIMAELLRLLGHMIQDGGQIGLDTDMDTVLAEDSVGVEVLDLVEVSVVVLVVVSAVVSVVVLDVAGGGNC